MDEKENRSFRAAIDGVKELLNSVFSEEDCAVMFDTPQQGECGYAEMEKELVALLGPDKLKNIGEQLAEIVRQHNLQHAPDVCRKLFSYFADVIDGWNRE